tara:strand:- start:1329 stop:1961 length:633 start_codon:yes stop_codon:yes gene_type:complete
MSILLLENYIKTILKENKELINVINIFDFDMTLFKSMSAPDHWNTKDAEYWWNSEKSLNQVYYKDKLDTLWIEDTVNAVIASASNPKALTVLCTARSETPAIVYVTNELLRLKGLKIKESNKDNLDEDEEKDKLEFDQNCLFYKPLGYSGSTAQYKTEVVERLLNSYSYAKEINFWEDNQQNLDAVECYINQNNKYNKRQIQFTPILVRA